MSSLKSTDITKPESHADLQVSHCQQTNLTPQYYKLKDYNCKLFSQLIQHL
uniref:Uncharacterized protein n=1 Tax=Anguilla anguilla TaxID=7936 RepID=A0A0E9SPS1_ANGAN